MADKNFRGIAPTVFPLGMTKSVKFLIDYSLAVSPSILVRIVQSLMER